MIKNHNVLEPPDYLSYRLSVKEVFLGSAGGLVFVWGTAWVTYRSYYAAVLMSPLVLLILLWLRRRKIKQRLGQLRKEFKEGLISIYSSLSAGSTLEGAFLKAKEDMKLCCGSDSLIYCEFRFLCKRMEVNWTVEQCFEDFARRSGDEDIQNLAEIITVAKRSRGGLVQIVKNGIDSTRIKMEVEQEIETMVSGKKREFHFMTAIPAGIILYMHIFSAGFLDILYDNMAGNIIMSICLAVYLLALYWGNQITNIKV